MRNSEGINVIVPRSSRSVNATIQAIILRFQDSILNGEPLYLDDSVPFDPDSSDPVGPENPSITDALNRDGGTNPLSNLCNAINRRYGGNGFAYHPRTTRPSVNVETVDEETGEVTVTEEYLSDGVPGQKDNRGRPRRHYWIEAVADKA